MADPVVYEAFIDLFEQHNKVSDEQLREHFKEEYAKLPTVINQLTSQNRIKIYQVNNMSVFELVDQQQAEKFSGLGPEARLIYQIIENSGSNGIWVRDIKTSTNLPQQAVTRNLNQLESKRLVKTVRSITSKSKKFYMLFDLTPSKQLTGDLWYTEQEFDHEFVDLLSKYIQKLFETTNTASLAQITEYIRATGVSKVELTEIHILQLITALIYDGKLEEVNPQLIGKNKQTKMYRLAPRIQNLNYLTDSPCGICPVFDQCHPEGIINPIECEYFNKWLSEDISF